MSVTRPTPHTEQSNDFERAAQVVAASLRADAPGSDAHTVRQLRKIIERWKYGEDTVGQRVRPSDADYLVEIGKLVPPRLGRDRSHAQASSLHQGELTMSRTVTRQEFAAAVNALWTEIEYQNNLPRRTDDEAKEPAAFATLGRRYLRKLEDDWADQPGPVVEDALHDLRKLSAIFLRGMIYCGIRDRE